MRCRSTLHAAPRQSASRVARARRRRPRQPLVRPSFPHGGPRSRRLRDGRVERGAGAARRLRRPHHRQPRLRSLPLQQGTCNHALRMTVAGLTRVACRMWGMRRRGRRASRRGRTPQRRLPARRPAARGRTWRACASTRARRPSCCRRCWHRRARWAQRRLRRLRATLRCGHTAACDAFRPRERLRRKNAAVTRPRRRDRGAGARCGAVQPRSEAGSDVRVVLSAPAQLLSLQSNDREFLTSERARELLAPLFAADAPHSKARCVALKTLGRCFGGSRARFHPPRSSCPPRASAATQPRWPPRHSSPWALG